MQSDARQVGLEAEVALIDVDRRYHGQVIINQANRWAAEIVVTGVQERKGLAPWLSASLADRIIRMAPVPVLLVPRP